MWSEILIKFIKQIKPKALCNECYLKLFFTKFYCHHRRCFQISKA